MPDTAEHPTYDETFIICEGNHDFRLDGKLLKLGPGDVILSLAELHTDLSAQVRT